jgi:hypothetical protein
LNSKTIENATAFVLFKSKKFPHNITENVISYLRKKFKVRELIPTTLEDGFAGFNIMVMLWGLGIDSIKPTLGKKTNFIDLLLSPPSKIMPTRTKI